MPCARSPRLRAPGTRRAGRSRPARSTPPSPAPAPSSSRRRGRACPTAPIRRRTGTPARRRPSSGPASTTGSSSSARSAPSTGGPAPRARSTPRPPISRPGTVLADDRAEARAGLLHHRTDGRIAAPVSGDPGRSAPPRPRSGAAGGPRTPVRKLRRRPSAILSHPRRDPRAARLVTTEARHPGPRPPRRPPTWIEARPAKRPLRILGPPRMRSRWITRRPGGSARIEAGPAPSFGASLVADVPTDEDRGPRQAVSMRARTRGRTRARPGKRAAASS